MEHAESRQGTIVQREESDVVAELLQRPASIEHTGLRAGALSDLALKTLYQAGEMTGRKIAEALCLPFRDVVDSVLTFLDRQGFVEVTGSSGFGEQAFRYAVSQKGTDSARELLVRSQYVGPAPVPLQQYNRMIQAQGVGRVRIAKEDLHQAFDGLVMNDATLDKLGPALNSGRSIFLYGPSGNGKTTVAVAMARMLASEHIYVPYAAEVSGHIIRIYDPILHHRISEPKVEEDLADSPFANWRQSGRQLDDRWVRIERPLVIVGGELTLGSLDLIYDSTSNYYEAPYQMKANGGMLVIDDLGRQQVNPRDLLNRWIGPLETRLDFLSLHSGAKIEVPFEQFVVFATNLNPAELVDAAFLRRIRHKILLPDPTPSEFKQVFRSVCERHEIAWDDGAFSHLMQEWYTKPGRAMRYSHSRDIVDQVLDICKYEGQPAQVTTELVDRACSSYFADL